MTDMTTSQQVMSMVQNRLEAEPVSQTAYYQPLKISRREIRILTLLAGITGEQIRCTLETICLSGAVSTYEALSYAWGNASQRCCIELDNRVFAVTPALESALEHLRYPDRTRRS
jgi:hypothetical protein